MGGPNTLAVPYLCAALTQVTVTFMAAHCSGRARIAGRTAAYHVGIGPNPSRVFIVKLYHLNHSYDMVVFQ